MSIQCLSCKNKTTKDRCPNRALSGIKFCGVHSKIKHPRNWTDVHKVAEKVTLIAKIWRGWWVRKLIRLAGPGVLNRSLCHNAEEITSFEPITSVDVWDYIGFEETGKVYGFDVRTLFDGFNRTLQPTNPYTRQPLSLDTRRRVRELYGYRFRTRRPLVYEHNKLSGAETILANRWLQLCQIAEENGFVGIHPNTFLSLNRTQLNIFLTMVYNDLKTWACEYKDTASKRFLYVYWIRKILSKYSETPNPQQYSFYVSTILLTILYNSTEPYTVCFILMSALYRL